MQIQRLFSAHHQPTHEVIHMSNIACRAILATLSLAAALASGAASAVDAFPSALAELIYAVPARGSDARATSEPDSATCDVFTDRRTGYVFGRTPPGWTFIGHIRSDAPATASSFDSSRQ
jgi:hypothetical protein